MNSKSRMSLFLTVLLLAFLVKAVSAEVLTIQNVTGAPGQMVQVSIDIDDPSKIAGAAFTITYNTVHLSLVSVTESSFFDHFVKGTEIPGLGTTISGAKSQAGSSERTILVLEFRIRTDEETGPGEITGDSSIAIVPSTINNPGAGYTSSVTIPLLTGIDSTKDPFTDPNGAFPSIATSIVEGTLSVDRDNDGLTDTEEGDLGTDKDKSDSDGDTMPDGWEVGNSLDPKEELDAVEDKDGDGFSNLREFISGTNPDNPDEVPSSLESDSDIDSDTDGRDLSEFIRDYGRLNCNGESPCQFDFNGDGEIDETDLQIFTEDFGRQL